MVKNIRAMLAAAAVLIATAFPVLAQGPGPGPGPGPTPNPWIVSGATIYYQNGGVIVGSPTLPGGTKGVGTINVSGGYYVNGAPIAPLTGGPLGTILQGQGTSSAPAWTTATYPATILANRILYASSDNVIVGLASANTGALVTSSAGVPSIATAAAYEILRANSAGTTVSFGSIDLSQSAAVGASILGLSNGGTNAALTASLGGIVYSGSSAFAVLSGTATARQMLQSGASAAPSWSTSTWPATTTINRILYSSAANVVGEISAVAGGLVNYNSSGVPAATITPVLGVAGSSVGTLGFQNATSGTITLSPPTGALGTVVLTLPASTDTLVGKATVDTFTNKTFDTAGSGNVFRINANAINAVTGTGSTVVLSAGPTISNANLTTPTIGVATGTSLALGGATIGANALAVTGTSLLTGNVTIASASLSLSGAISSAAWTTNGVRYKNVAATLTDTSSSGTVAAAYTNAFGGNTIAASSLTTFTNYFNSYFVDPVAGTNVTFTNKWALGADSVKFGTSNQMTVANNGATLVAGGLTVTTSFTATGLVTNASLANPSMTVNGTTCTLGSPCTITATATTITVGTTLVSGGTTTRILYNNAGTLGEYTISGSGTVVAMATSPSFTTPALGVATGASLALGGCTIGSDVLCTTGSVTFTGAVVVSSASFSLSGNISSAAWTTNGIRFKNATATLTDTTSSGTVAAAYSSVFGGNTIAASNPTTFTNYYGAFFNEPAAGSNVTLTNKYALGATSLNVTNTAAASIFDAATGFRVAGAAASGNYLRGNGTNFVSAAIQAGDLPLGSSSAFGAVKVDGTTITASGGVITAVGAAATSVSVGTTTVASGTDLYLLYNNAGTLGNRTIASILTAGSGITITGTTNATVAMTSGATTQQSPANPTGTTSGTGVMMGLGSSCTITPARGTKVVLIFDGYQSNSTANGGVASTIRYGTGTAPTNGAALTGTAVGSGVASQLGGASSLAPFSNVAVVTGLSIGTAYWFDVGVSTLGSGTASVGNVNCSAVEAL